MPFYKTTIIETLRKEVVVEAVDEDEARDRVDQLYESGAIEVTGEDFFESDYDDFEESDCVESLTFGLLNEYKQKDWTYYA